MIKKIKKRGIKEIHKKPFGRWNKQVLQNKPISFRPTDKQAIFFKRMKDVTETSNIIRKSINFRKEFFEDPEKFFIKWGRKLDEPFERANRKIKREKKERRLIYL